MKSSRNQLFDPLNRNGHSLARRQRLSSGDRKNAFARITLNKNTAPLAGEQLAIE